MKSPREKDLEDDVCVRAETIMRLFTPKPAKSTFHAWVNKGLIVPARGLQGYYLLNATRVHLGMNPLDMKEAREELLNPKTAKAKKKTPPKVIDVRKDPPDYMTVEEAAEYLTVSSRFIRGQVADWNLKYVKAGGRIILRKQDLDNYAERRLRGPELQ